MIKGILTACLLMLIQSPSPEPEKAWLRWINSAPWDRAEQQSQPEYQEQYTKNVATPPPDKDHEQTRSEGANKANEKSSDIWQKAFAPEQWPQWALLVVGLFGVVAALWSLCLLSKQVKADIVAANAAKVSADVANRSLLLLERARVAIEDFRFVISKDQQTFSWTFLVFNSGPTPARIIERCLGYLNWDDATPLPEKPIYGGQVNKGEFVVYGGQRIRADDDWMPLRTEEIPVLYAVGYYKYLDIFDVEHTTTYGFRYRPGNKAILIEKPGYNYAT